METNKLQILDHFLSPFSGSRYDFCKDRESGKMLLLVQNEGEEKKICFEEK
jgi:hypothetical protein